MSANVDVIFSNIRKLSNTNYYQSLYNLDNKSFTIELFQNSSNLSPLQVIFLNYLGFYAGLHLDVYMGEVDERVFENIVYEDAYTYYKRKMKKSDVSPMKKIPKSPDNTPAITSQWVFKNPKKVS
jgi:hypothetical protein